MYDEAERALGAWAYHYNNERFSLALRGPTPAEVVAAKLPTIQPGYFSLNRTEFVGGPIS